MTRFDLRLDRESYSPGDTVRGWVTVIEGGRSRRLEAILSYRERTRDCDDVGRRVEGRPLHAGDLEAGQRFEFSLALPRELAGHRSAHGELYWEAEVRSDEPGRDARERRRIEVADPVSPPASVQGEPEPVAPAPPPRRLVLGSPRDVLVAVVLFAALAAGVYLVSGGDAVAAAYLIFPLGFGCVLALLLLRRARGFEVTPAAREVRRGGAVQATVTRSAGGGDPRRPLRAGLVCTERYALMSADGRVLLEAPVHEQWEPIATLPASVRFEVPPDAPPSYDGSAVSHLWSVRLHESRRGPDRTAEAPIVVRP